MSDAMNENKCPDRICEKCDYYKQELKKALDMIEKLNNQLNKKQKSKVPESIISFISNIELKEIIEHTSASIYEKYIEYCDKNDLNIETKYVLGRAICNRVGVKSIAKRYGKVVHKTYTKV